MADWISMTASAAAPIGLLFTGYQVWVLNRQTRHDHRVVLDGVAVSWRPKEAPSHAERPDGTSKWVYELVLVNPGQLPIDDVQIQWTFPCPVVRVRHDGILDSPTTSLTLSAPVVAGGGTRAWNRTLIIAYSRKDELIHTYAEVTFNDIDGDRHRNRWPRVTRQPLTRTSAEPAPQTQPTRSLEVISTRPDAIARPSADH